MSVVGSVFHLPNESRSLRDERKLLDHFINQSSNWYLTRRCFRTRQVCAERWFADGNSDLKVTAQAKPAFLPFGGGVHICLGMNFWLSLSS
jgi:hypothetical protein